MKPENKKRKLYNPITKRYVSISSPTGKRILSGEQVVIYTRSGCPYCKKAKKLFDSKKIPYKNVLVVRGKEDRILEKVDPKTNYYRYFPIIFMDGKFIGGYSELQEKLTK